MNIFICQGVEVYFGNLRCKIRQYRSRKKCNKQIRILIDEENERYFIAFNSK